MRGRCYPAPHLADELRPEPPKPVTKHKFVTGGNSAALEDELDDLAAQGWTVVNLSCSTYRWVVLLTREELNDY